MKNFNGFSDEEMLARYLAGEASAPEIREVEEWAAESDENEAELDAWTKAWNKAKAPAEEKKFNTDAAWLKVKSRITAPTEESPVVPLRQFGEPEIRKRDTDSNSSKWWRVAAALLFLFGIFSLLFWPKEKDQFADADIITVTSKQDAITVRLPDSSTVILNPNSTLKYHSDFKGEERIVAFSGAAYFDVQKNAAKPFVIQAEKGFVRVLGTSFIVNTAEEHGKLNVSVQSGKVLVSHEKKSESEEDSSAVIILPGQQAELDKDMDVIKVSVSDPVLERFEFDKTLVFEHTDLKTVTELLSKMFKMKVQLRNPELMECLLTATFKNQELPEIMQIIATTFGLDLISTDSTYTLDGKGC